MLNTAFTKTQLNFVKYGNHKKFQQNHSERNLSNALNNYSSNSWLIAVHQKRKKRIRGNNKPNINKQLRKAIGNGLN